MNTSQHQNQSFRLTFEEAAADVEARVSLRRAWEADTCAVAQSRPMMPSASGGRDRRLLRAAFRLETASLARRLSPWTAATSDAGGITFILPPHAPDPEPLAAMVKETVVAAIMARISASVSHPLASDDREEAGLALQKLLTLFTPRARGNIGCIGQNIEIV